MSGFSAVDADAILDAMVGGPAYQGPGTLYLALLTVVPTDAVTAADLSEIAYTGYARVAVHTADFNAASGRSKTNVNAFAFPLNTGATVTPNGWALLDAAALGTGNVRSWGAIPVPAPINNGDTPNLPAGSVNLGVT